MQVAGFPDVFDWNQPWVLLTMLGAVWVLLATESLSERKQRIIDYVASMPLRDEGKHGPFIAMANFAKYEQTGESAHLEKAVAQADMSTYGWGAMFRIHNLANLWVRFKQHFPDWLAAKYREALVEYPAYTHDDQINGPTENHKLMYACAAVLAHQEWPEFPERTYQICREWLLEELALTVRRGKWEYDSPTYWIHHMGPIHGLAQHFHCNDQCLQDRAKLVLDWYFINTVGELNRGFWMMTNGRNQHPCWNGPASPDMESAALFWMYLGKSRPPVFGNHRTVYSTTEFAVSDYDIPDIVRSIALDRTRPYIHRERHGRGPQPYKTTYMHPDYAVYSQIDNGGRHPQSHRWAVSWVVDSADREPSVFFMKHALLEHTSYDDVSLACGTDGSEQVLQHEGTLLAVYRIDGGDEWITGPLSRNGIIARKEEGGWLFAHTGKMLFGVRTSKEYTTPKGDYCASPALGIIRSDGARNGLVVETAPLADFAGGGTKAELDKFSEAILARTRTDDSRVDAAQPRLSFTNLKGDTLDITFDGDRLINGQSLDLEDWPLLDNPWIHQDWYGRYLTLKYGDATRTYDFETWMVE